MGTPPPPPATILHNQELLAIYADNPATQSFLRLWGPMGVYCDTHFIIIFFKPSTAFASMMRPLHSRFSLDSPRSIPSSVGPSSATGSRDSPVYQAPPLSNENMRAWDTMVATGGDVAVGGDVAAGSDVAPQSQSVISREESPVGGLGVSTSSHSHLSGNQATFDRLLSHPPSTHTATDVICLVHNEVADITEDALTSAKYNSSAGALLSMVLNHRSMVQILDWLGLWEKSAFSDTKTVVFQGGQVFSSAEIVRQFGWSLNSFRHKSTWYGWAEVVATSFKWNAPIPG